MARVSELEQSGADTLEVAISQSEFDQLGDADSPLELRVTLLHSDGSEFGSFLLSTNPLDWTLDGDTGEYTLVEPTTGFGNHRTHWSGLVLSKVNATGLDTVKDALMIGPFGEAVDHDGTLATTVLSATHIAAGTALTLIDQSVVVGSSGEATLRFDAPDISTPIVARGAGLGDTGSGPPICFANGTMITTQFGDCRVEDLTVGTSVWTQNHGMQPIRWVGKRHVSAEELTKDAKKRPVRIGTGALGDNLPNRDLRVSRQHRLVLRAPDDGGLAQVLVAAHRLTRLQRVSLVCPKHGITYYHLLFDRHEIVRANGLLAESLLLGDQAKDLVGPSELAEIRLRIASTSHAESPALPIPDAKTQYAIVRHHALDQELA